jgi:adenine-specific DNA-methyltransferase
MEGQPSRLNYIGSKYQLLEWLESQILAATGWSFLAGHRIADLFAGTGIVSYFFRIRGAIPVANDVEPYSHIITSAFVSSSYTGAVAAIIDVLRAELTGGYHNTTPPGHITRTYSPFENSERMYFTVENARRIDYLRRRLEEIRPVITHADFTFLLASLLTSADSVANVASTYGCYLKSFKKTAARQLDLRPVHRISTAAHPDSRALLYDARAIAGSLRATVEAAYLDPPYNERQYSKNYFVLNAIALTPAEAASSAAVHGKTGIPADCFVSPFCRKREVADAFRDLIGELREVPWIFVSYSNESLLSREEMTAILAAYGTVSVVTRPHKRFKAYEYNEGTETEEYLFCLKTAGISPA